MGNACSRRIGYLRHGHSSSRGPGGFSGSTEDGFQPRFSPTLSHPRRRWHSLPPCAQSWNHQQQQQQQLDCLHLVEQQAGQQQLQLSHPEGNVAMETEGEGMAEMTLVDLVVAHICENMDALPSLSSLPPDLAQRVFNHLVDSQLLKQEHLGAFASSELQELFLPGQPRLTDSWLVSLRPHAPTLLHVDLSSCRHVSDLGILQLTKAHELRTLCLDGCLRVTDGGLLMLQDCPRLSSLSLAGCPWISKLGVQRLASSLPSLVSLDLHTCPHVSGGFQRFHLLSGLRYLDLGWCNSFSDEDLRHLAPLHSLEHLNVSRSKVTDYGVSFIGGLTNLRFLALAGCDITNDAFSTLAMLTSLETLDLEWCEEVTFQGIKEIQGLFSLRFLNLAYTAVNDAALCYLEGMPFLTDLNLDSCDITNSGLESLSGLQHLSSLNLSDCRVSDRGMATIKTFPRLGTLNLSYTKVSDEGLRHLAKCTSLHSLNLDTQSVTDAGLAHIAGLISLTCLDLFGAKVTDAGLAHLKPLKQLRWLEICSGGLTDVGLATLSSSFPFLTGLNISQNGRISDKGVGRLAALTSLEALNLSGSRVGEPGLSLLLPLPSLRSLSLHGCSVTEGAMRKLRGSPECMWQPDLVVTGIA